MSFGRRLRLYLFGVLMGSVLVFFFFNDRLNILTDWLPGNRVLDRLQETKPFYAPKALCQLECYTLDTLDVDAARTSGDVKFGLSETQRDPKKYVVEAELKGNLYRLDFLTADSVNTLSEINAVEGKSCDC